MSFFLDEDTALSTVNETNFATGDKTGFTENLKAAYNYGLQTELSNSELLNTVNKYGEIIATAQGLGHTSLVNPFDDDPYATEIIGPEETGILPNRNERVDAFHEKLNELQKTDLNLAKALKDKGIDTKENMEKQIGVDAQEAYKNFADIKSRSTGMGTFGSYVGMGGAVFQDPLILSTLPLGMMYSLPKNFLAASVKIGMIEAALAATAEIGIQTQVQPYRKKLGFEDEDLEILGLTLTPGETRVAAATLAGLVGGPALFGLFKGIGKGIDLTGEGLSVLKGKLEDLPLTKVRQIYQEIIKKNPKYKNPDIEDTNLENLTKDDSPFIETPDSNAEHVARGNEVANYVLNEGKISTVVEPPKSNIQIEKIDNYNGTLKTYDPDEIIFEPQIFQYKTGGDAFGVTKKLKDVELWDQPSAGVVLTYKFRDGRVAIVDGHQRLGLAKRLKAKGQNIKLVSYTFNEADDIPADMVMVKGMLMNLRNNTGSATDAARVLRSRFGLDWEKIRLSLPPQMKIVKNAMGLSKLSDDAWGLFLTKNVNEDLASRVGTFISNKNIHNKVLAALMSRKFNSLQEMDTVLMQIERMPTVKGTQETLFGKEFFEETLILEKAKIINDIVKNKKKLSSAFKTIVEQETDLSAAGNVLKRQSNINKGEENAKILEKINIVATRVGQLSDDLNNAAKLYKQGDFKGSREAATEAIERAVERGDFDGVSLSGPVRNDTIETTTPGISKAEKLENEIDLKDLETHENYSKNTSGLDKQTDELENNLFGEELPTGEQRLALSLEEDALVTEIKNAAPTLENVKKYQNHPIILKKIEEAKKFKLDTSQRPGFAEGTYFATRDFGDGIVGAENFIEKIYGEGAKIKNKQFVIIMGPTASGKSTTVNQIKKELGAIVADSDDIKKMLPEYAKGYNADGVHVESSVLNMMLLKKASDNGDNIIFPTTGRQMKNITKMTQIAEDKGYTVKVRYVTAPREELLLRNTSRILLTNRIVKSDLLDETVVNQIEKNYINLNEKYQDGITNTGINRTQPGIGQQSGKSNIEDAGPGAFIDEEQITKLSPEDTIQSERIISDTGEVIVTERTVKEILENEAQDAKFLERLKDCT